ncbi:MAG: hydantoinase/oxoprolinase family protein, partial [Desulfatiglandales bacterium]|nr:hydantoinase/oxoprolinase family protein [Desulfatiglandales bacterium]
MKYVIGVDSGGTFTDVVLVNEEGSIYFDKAMSTPQDPTHGIISGVENCAGLIQPKGDIHDILSHNNRFCHGTTVATNALIERKGAQVGLIMTKGFEDTTIISRGPMARVMGISPSKAMDFIHTERADPLVPKAMIRGVPERVGMGGEVIVPLVEADVIEAANDLVCAGAEIIAVCLLWSFRNSSHEKRIRELISNSEPNIQVHLSSEISPLIGEYERASSTVVNTYIAPVIVRYINNLQAELTKLGLNRPVQIMKSSGGLIPPEYISKEAVSTLNSGPVGGVMASKHLGAVMGHENIITTDMGGTSFDVGVIYRGEVEEERTPFVSHGIPVQVPTVKVVSIGAGGGSIAWTDGARLMVGPQSAGADPGPACYNQGGHKPTVTDALVLLGFLDPENFFGGRKTLDRAKAEAAIREKVAKPLGLDIMEAAAGIYEIVTAKMSDLIRKVTVESGYDPREFTLFAFGGAGPPHCAIYGKALGVKEIIVPRTAAVFSALGIALSDIKYTYTRSELLPIGADTLTIERVNRVYADMVEKALADMDASGFSSETITLFHKMDVRYVGQMNELTIPWKRKLLTPETVKDIRMIFEQTY